MGKMLKCIALIVFVCALSLQTFAHPGDLQNEGTPEQGHYDRSTGEYHYHHSNIHEGACQYPADECPLNFDNKDASVAERNESSKGNKSDSNKPNSETSYDAKDDSASKKPSIVSEIILYCTLLLFFSPCIVMFLEWVSECISSVRDKLKKNSQKQVAEKTNTPVIPEGRILDGKDDKPSDNDKYDNIASQNQEQKPKAKRVKMVYYTPRGKSFHRIKSCPKLARSKNIQKAPFDEMKWKLLPCETCYKNHWKYM